MARPPDPIHREAQRSRIVELAAGLFLEHGYDGTSMVKLAAAAEVAPNTLYWYFEDKDALLVAVLETVVDQFMAAFDRRAERPLADQLRWLVRTFAGAASLIGTVHARASASERVRVWHEAFHEQLELRVAARLQGQGTSKRDAAAAARVALFTVEGLLAHGRDDSVVDWIARALTPPTKR
jgi:AcrR family transcriptional regulator